MAGMKGHNAALQGTDENSNANKQARSMADQKSVIRAPYGPLPYRVFGEAASGGAVGHGCDESRTARPT